MLACSIPCMTCLSAGVSDNEYENDGRDDSAESQQGWNILTGSRRPSSVTISLDGVDSRLLNKLDMKFQRLSNESRKSSLARRRIATCRECPLVISWGHSWVDPTLLGLMKTFINKNISRDPASSSDIIAFLRVKLMLSLYKVRSQNVKTDHMIRWESHALIIGFPRYVLWSSKCWFLPIVNVWDVKS